MTKILFQQPARGWRFTAADRSIVAHARRSKKILAAATVMDGSALPTIDARPVASLSTKHSRAAGYRAAI